jgi:hypothetical protein
LNGSAFDRAPKDTDGLSVNRRHILAQDPLEDEAEIGKVVGSHLKMGATSQFAELNVGLMLDALDDFEQEIFVCEDPLPAVGAALENPAHALVVGLPFAGEVVGSLQSELAGDRLRKIVCHIFPAVMKAPA